jgi:hypothetical protein
MKLVYIRSADEFAATVKLGHTTESLWLDFKHSLERKKEGAQKEICRDIAQFANTEGGCFLVGVSETTNPDSGLKVAKEIEAVVDPDGDRGWIEQAISKHLVPATLTKFIEFPTTPQGIVIAVNVPPSRHTVHVWDRDRHTMECVHRTNHGKAYMNPDEMERHMMNGSRATMLAMKDVVGRASTRDVVIAGGLRNSGGGMWRPTVHIGELAEGSFEVSAITPGNPSMTTTIPYELVKAVWLLPSGGIGLVLDGATLGPDREGGLMIVM